MIEILKKVNDNWYESKWLYFHLIEHKPRTTVWEVINKKNFRLGTIVI